MRKYGYVVLVCALSIVAFIYLLKTIWPFTVDDSFITFRYSLNLASGYGPTWNPGAPHIEGYTTFLWMLIMAIPHIFAADPILFAKIISIVLTISGSMIIWRLVIILGGKPIGAALSIFIYAIFPLTALHTVSGMETSLAGFLTILLIYFSIKANVIFIPIVGLLLSLTRPEESLFVFICIGTTLLVSVPIRKQLSISTVVLYGLPGLIYFLWRYVYFGNLFPLSFYIKTGNGLSGLGIVGNFILTNTIIFCAPIYTVFRKFSANLLILIIPTIAHLAFYLFPDHIMGYGWRFLFPLIPIILVFVGVGLSGWKLSTAVPFVVLASILLISTSLPEFIARRSYADSLERSHVWLGKKLSNCKFVGSIAVPDAGAIPYYSQWQAIDTFGLNDATIAISGRRDPSYVLNQKPDILVIVSSEEDRLNPYHDYVNSLYDAAINNGMVRTKILKFDYSYYLWIMTAANGEAAGCLLDIAQSEVVRYPEKH